MVVKECGSFVHVRVRVMTAINVLVPAGSTSNEIYISQLGELFDSSEELSLHNVPVEELLYSVKSYCYSGQYPLNGADSRSS